MPNKAAFTLAQQSWSHHQENIQSALVSKPWDG